MNTKPSQADRVNSVITFIIVPAYNEVESIPSVVGKLLEKYPNVVVVDDGSSDGTSDALFNQPVYLLRHLINRGQGAALQTGIQFALQRGANILVTFDSDGQHDVSDIDSLIKPVMQGECEIALGSRFLGKAHGIPLTRKIVLKTAVLVTRIVSGIRITDVHNGLRAFSCTAAGSFNITMDRMAHASEILDQIKESRLTYKEVPVNIYYSDYSRGKGQSTWNAFRIVFQLIWDRFVT